MGLRIVNFLTANWLNADESRQKGEGLFGLRAWLERTTHLFSPSFSFVACGSYSDPAFSPLPASVAVVNAGVPFTVPYSRFYWNYAGAAQTAAFAYLANRTDWDLAVNLDNDVLVGAVDFDALLHEFAGRPELILTPDWHGRPGGHFYVWKPAGVVRWQNMRRRANLIEEGAGVPEPPLIENETGDIFKGLWWNPWPHLPTMRQDYGQPDPSPERRPLNQDWPFVRLPHPAIIDEYLTTRTPLAKPLCPTTP